MEEWEWLSRSRDPRPMLELVRGESQRKLTLLAAAFIRRVWDGLPNEAFRELTLALEVGAENEARSAKDSALWERAKQLANAAFSTRSNSIEQPPRAWYHALAPVKAFEAIRLHISSVASLTSPVDPVQKEQAESIQCRLIREVFGNPFCSVKYRKRWRTDTAAAIARQMYDSRDFSAMPILADALQDAGCDNADILTHCRDANQVHVRGCWVVDLVLGKA